MKTATEYFNPCPKNKPIRLKARDRELFKRDLLINRAKSRCETCGKWLPIRGSVFQAAHLSHIKSYGAGGGDTSENCKIECYQCHINERHGLKWSKDETN